MFNHGSIISLWVYVNTFAYSKTSFTSQLLYNIRKKKLVQKIFVKNKT